MNLSDHIFAHRGGSVTTTDQTATDVIAEQIELWSGDWLAPSAYGRADALTRALAAAGYAVVRLPEPVDADAEFIAWAREGVPKLMAEVERLTGKLNHLLKVVDTYEQESVKTRAQVKAVQRIIDNEQTTGWANTAIRYDGSKFPVMVSVDEIRRALDGENDDR